MTLPNCQQKLWRTIYIHKFTEVVYKREGMPMHGARRTSSICYERTNTPRSFHECTSENDTRCFVREEIEVIETKIGYVRRKELETFLIGYVSLAKYGKLTNAEKSEYNPLAIPCASQPDIWELRIQCGRVLYRLYYSENGTREPEFVALALQKKDTIGKSEQEIKTEQNRFMQLAQERYSQYADRKWGHVARDCQYCM